MSSLVAFGVSETLIADFQALRETPCAEGNKYNAKTIDQLAQYICCRNYANLTLELSYLNWAVCNYMQQRGGLLSFYWLEEAISPKKVRHAFSQAKSATWLPKNTAIDIGSQGLELFFGKQVFVISATRVQLLSAFMELLTTHFPQILDDTEAALLGRHESDIKQLASLLQKKIYKWLKQHLPTAKLQQRFRYLDNWLLHNASNSPYPNKIDDGQVLAFWQSSIHEEGYVKFTTALDDIVLHQDALRSIESAAAASYGLSIDDYAQILCDDHDALYQNVQEQDHALSAKALTVYPKFLVAKDFERLVALLSVYSANLNLPLSVLRHAIMGAWQGRIIQASRYSPTAVKQQLSVMPALQYKDFCAQLVNIKQVNKFTLLCISGALYNLQSSSCLSVLSGSVGDMLSAEQGQQIYQFISADLAKEEAKSKCAAESSFKVADAEFSFEKLQRWQLQQPALNKIFNAAKKALSKNNRAGFKAGDDTDEELLLAGADALNKINQMIDTFLAHFKQTSEDDADTTTLLEKNKQKEHQHNDLRQIYSSDLFIFKDELQKRHRGKHE